MTQKIPKAVAIVGPTAGGKTALSLGLAKALDGQIICCDSMQIYCGMDIGTAKATPEERRQAIHHMLDVCDPEKSFSAADYAAMATPIAEELSQKGILPIFCGGTGLYLEAVRTARHAAPPPPDAAFRQQMQQIAETQGNKALYERLAAIDPEAAQSIHPNNLPRIIRALEIFHASGRTKTDWEKAGKEQPPAFDILTFCLVYHDRSLLYERIDRRVDDMMAQGLWEETEALYRASKLPPDSTAAQAIGYKQIIQALENGETKMTATENIKLATRHYAKRQLTWFLAHAPVLLYADEDGHMRNGEDILAEALPQAKAFLKE